MDIRMNKQMEILEPAPIVAEPIPVGKNKGYVYKHEYSAKICQWLALIILATGCFLVINRFILQTVQVQGHSMVPTLHDADRCFLNRWIYYLHPPRTGDVVVLKDPSDGGYAVKRIIGTSGDSVHLKGGGVFVNGRRLNEPYLLAGVPTYTGSLVSEELIVCGRNQYFVLGDNRTNSLDSRVYGPVPRQNILGAILY
jgi:signal peptidase I